MTVLKTKLCPVHPLFLIVHQVALVHNYNRDINKDLLEILQNEIFFSIFNNFINYGYTYLIPFDKI